MNWQAEIFGNMAVVGQNPELADFDNPRGYIISEVFNVFLTANDGSRLCGPSVKGPESKLAAAIQRSLDKGYDPTKSEAFRPVQPAYGSEAYIRGGWEYENAIIERNDAEIYG